MSTSSTVRTRSQRTATGHGRRRTLVRAAAAGACGTLAITLAACTDDGPGDRLSDPERYANLSQSENSGDSGDAGGSGDGAGTAAAAPQPSVDPDPTVTPGSGSGTTTRGAADHGPAESTLANANGSCRAERASLAPGTDAAELHYRGSAGDQVRYAYMFTDGHADEGIATVPAGGDTLTVSGGPAKADLTGVGVSVLLPGGESETCLVPLNGPAA